MQWIPEQIVGIGEDFHSQVDDPKITYVHTAQRETIFIHEALEKTVMPNKMKLILKARTQMVESMMRMTLRNRCV